MSKGTSWWIEGPYAYFAYSTKEEACKVCEWTSTCSNRYTFNAKVVMYVGKDQLSQPTVCIDVHAAVDYFRNNVID